MRNARDEIGDACMFAPLDLTRTDVLPDFAAALFRDFGGIDILVNNAGNTLKMPFEGSSMEEFDQSSMYMSAALPSFPPASFDNCWRMTGKERFFSFP